MQQKLREERYGERNPGWVSFTSNTIGLPKNNTVEAARRIIGGEAHPFDVGGFDGDKYFAYIAAFGAFTEVSYATPQYKKKALGHLAYVLEGANYLPKIGSVNTRVEYDGGVVEAKLLYGSMKKKSELSKKFRFLSRLAKMIF